MSKNVFKYPAIFVLIMVFLGGCKLESAAQAVTESPRQPQSQQFPGKPGASVRLIDQQPIFMESAGVYEFEIGLLAPHSSGEAGVVGAARFMRVLVSASEGIEILSMQNVFEFDENRSGEYQLPLKINVQNLGRHYINLHISLNENGAISTRALTAIVQAGKSPVKAQKASPASSKSTTDVIALPAQETISSQ